MILAVALLAAACGGEERSAADRPPAGAAENIVLITIDTLRADALGFMGQDAVETPVLDRLAASGRVFTHAHAHSVVTLPSHANILTGRYPYEHGVRGNGGFVLGDGHATLAGLLRDQGFATAAFVAAYPLAAEFGLDRGFDVYDDDFGAKKEGQLFGFPERRGDEVVDRSLAWWRAHVGAKRFLWIHLFDPHIPYAPPEPFASRFKDPYLGEVAAVDSFLAPLLEPFLAGKERPTLIALTADHGEARGDHGEPTHGLFAYESTLAVPLVLWGAGISPERDDRLARHVDLLPTVLESVGVAASAELPGRSLFAPRDGAPESSYFEALMGYLAYRWAPLRGVIEAGEKYVELPIPEFYDLASDPGETTNLVDSRWRTVAKLRRGIPAESVWPPDQAALSRAEAEAFRALGYLSASGNARRAFGPEDDPKRLVHLHLDVNRMEQLAKSGRVDEAIAVGREILVARPDMVVVYEQLAPLLARQGRAAQAVELLRRAEALGLLNEPLRAELGLALVRLGRPGEALAVFAGGDREASDPAALTGQAIALATLGRYDDARRALDTVLAEDAENAGAHEALSFVALQAGRFDDAVRHARRALAVDRDRPTAWNNLGLGLYNLGRPGDAYEAWRRAAALDASDPDVLFNLGLVAAELGRTADARSALTRFVRLVPAGSSDPRLREARRILAEAAP